MIFGSFLWSVKTCFTTLTCFSVLQKLYQAFDEVKWWNDIRLEFFPDNQERFLHFYSYARSISNNWHIQKRLDIFATWTTIDIRFHTLSLLIFSRIRIIEYQKSNSKYNCTLYRLSKLCRKISLNILATHTFEFCFGWVSKINVHIERNFQILMVHTNEIEKNVIVFNVIIISLGFCVIDTKRKE